MSEILSVADLSLRFGDTQVLRNVTFSLNAGEIVTIVGPNGSGKSSLLRCLIGAAQPTAGKIQKTRNIRIGYIPQKLEIATTLPMTAGRFLELTAHDRRGVDTTLEQVGCEHLSDTQLTNLSGGQLQRVLLARAIQNQPQLLILDEATRGLDQRGSAQFYQTIASIRDTTNCAVLMVSHELHVVMAASDRVICLNGHVCCHGTPQVVQQAEEYRALFGTGTGGALALYKHDHDHTHDDHSNCDGTHTHV